MTDSTSRPNRRREPLTRDAVIAGAVELADRIGIDPLTIRRLATHLGVKPMAIYHHVANKDEILDGMVDQVFDEIELPPRDLDWKEAMRARARSARHPWAAGMMESRSNPGPATLRHHDSVIGCLRAGGLSPAMVGHAYALLDAYIYGAALQEAALPFDTPEEAAMIAGAMVDQFPADEYPHLAAFTLDHVLRPGYDFGDEFEFGLALVLDGLEAAAR
jgi:AcrR family transcriptional regulator